MNKEKFMHGISWVATGAFAALSVASAVMAGLNARQADEVMKKYNQEISEFKTTEEYYNAVCSKMSEIEALDLTDAEKEKKQNMIEKDEAFVKSEYAKTLNDDKLADFAEAEDAEEKNKMNTAGYVGISVALGFASSLSIVGTQTRYGKEIELEM